MAYLINIGPYVPHSDPFDSADDLNPVIDPENCSTDPWYSGNTCRPQPTDGTYRLIENKCQCGAEKCGSPGHAPWCPRYIKFTK